MTNYGQIKKSKFLKIKTYKYNKNKITKIKKKSIKLRKISTICYNV